MIPSHTTSDPGNLSLSLQNLSLWLLLQYFCFYLPLLTDKTKPLQAVSSGISLLVTLPPIAPVTNTGIHTSKTSFDAFRPLVLLLYPSLPPSLQPVPNSSSIWLLKDLTSSQGLMQLHCSWRLLMVTMTMVLSPSQPPWKMSVTENEPNSLGKQS